MDDIRPEDLPEGSPASEGVPPRRKGQLRRVGPESEVRGGPEAPLGELDEQDDANPAR